MYHMLIPYTAAFSGLRAYALSGPSIILGLVTFLLSSVAIAVNLVRRYIITLSRESLNNPQTQYHWLTGFNDPMYGCTNILSIPDYLVHR